MFQIFLRMIQKRVSKNHIKEQGYLTKNAYLISKRRILLKKRKGTCE
jgi:hypothetical protein